jgi:hypothetical protein
MPYSYNVLTEKYGLIDEATTYQLPSSPKYYMADFYMLSLISTIDFDRLLQPTPANPQGIVSAIRGEKYKDDIDYAKSVLFPRLQQIILEDTFFSITCEAYHAAEILINQNSYGEIDYDEVIAELPVWYKQLMRYVIKYVDKHGSERDRVRRNDISSEERSTYTLKYKAVAEFLKSKGIPKRSYIEITTKLFREDNFWEESYGGEPWAQIGEAWLQLDTIVPTDYNKLAVYIDHIYDLEHNTGTVFNKIQRYHQDIEQDKSITSDSMFQGYQWISELLDFKAALNNPYDLLPRTSSSMQKLASPVLKAAGYTRDTMQNPDEQYHYKREDEYNAKEYWTDRNGFLNREGKPAQIRYFIDKNGTRSLQQVDYYTHGNLNRTDGPASISYAPNETEPIQWIYYANGKIHREDGPAYYVKKMGVDYYLHGQKVSKEEVELYHSNRPEFEKKQKKKTIEPSRIFKVDKSNPGGWVHNTELLLVDAIVYLANSKSKSYIENVYLQVYPGVPIQSIISGHEKIYNNYIQNELPKFLTLYVQKDRYDKVINKISKLTSEIAQEMAKESVWGKDGIYRGPGGVYDGSERFNDTNILKIRTHENKKFQEISKILGTEFYLSQIAGSI